MLQKYHLTKECEKCCDTFYLLFLKHIVMVRTVKKPATKYQETGRLWKRRSTAESGYLLRLKGYSCGHLIPAPLPMCPACLSTTPGNANRPVHVYRFSNDGLCSEAHWYRSKETPSVNMCSTPSPGEISAPNGPSIADYVCLPVTPAVTNCHNQIRALDLTSVKWPAKREGRRCSLHKAHLDTHYWSFHLDHNCH